jgi:class 3 adenylate cyclase
MSLLDDGLRGSEGRLWKLIESRRQPGADAAKIESRIWDLFGEEWAIMFTDLTGFSRRAAEFGIIHFLDIIHRQRDIVLPLISDHDGIVIKMEADSFLVIFRRPERAMECGISMQRACQEFSRGRPQQEQLLICLGLSYGRILRIGDTDVWGAQVNAASKLGEDIAISHEILVTRAFKDAVGGLPGVVFEATEDDVPGADGTFRARYEVSMPLP